VTRDALVCDKKKPRHSEGRAMSGGNGRLPHATEADALPCEMEEHRGFQLLLAA